VAADRLDDPDYPAYTTGRAAEVLGVQQAFLRALDAAGVVTPERSAGGHRRYTRRQLAFAGRIRETVRPRAQPGFGPAHPGPAR
jgi:MerR family transcriptional regulator/heat shock protein HspR